MPSSIKNNIIKQILMLLLIILLIIVVIWKLKYFIPGGLGAITLYILLRGWYFRLVERKGWKKWIAATVFIIGFIVAIALPIYGVIAVLTPMVNDAISNTANIQKSVIQTIDYVNAKVPQLELSTEKVLQFLQKGLTIVPAILQSTASVFANIFTALFILYFMFMGGRKMEKGIRDNIPLYRKNRDDLWNETKVLVVSNALGIPFLAICQGLVAILGYWIFGVPNAVLWGLLTGLATIIPVVGTMVVWVPVCIFLLANGQVGTSIGVAIYCLVVVGSIDNILRMLFVKKFGDVHPLITIFGVLLGLEVFGLMGLIFGPLLLSYVLLLIRIYKTEFGSGDSSGEAPPPLVPLTPEELTSLEINQAENDETEKDS